MTALYALPEICYFNYMLGFLYKSSIHQQKEVNVKKEWNVMKKTHFLPQTTLISKLQWQILFRLLPCQLRQWARDIQTQLSTSGKQGYFWKYPAFFKDDQIHVKTFENWNILSSLQRKKTQTRGVHYKGLHKPMSQQIHVVMLKLEIPTHYFILKKGGEVFVDEGIIKDYKHAHTPFFILLYFICQYF